MQIIDNVSITSSDRNVSRKTKVDFRRLREESDRNQNVPNVHGLSMAKLNA